MIVPDLPEDKVSALRDLVQSPGYAMMMDFLAEELEETDDVILRLAEPSDIPTLRARRTVMIELLEWAPRMIETWKARITS